MNKREKKSVDGWEVSSDKVLLETPVATIKSGPVYCKKSGIRKDFIRFDFPEWVNVIALTPESEILLIKQFRYGSNRVEIEIPGGVVESGEQVLEAGCRELLEETGYAGINAKIIGKVCPNPAIQHNYCHTVLVENAIKVADPSMDDMEDINCFLKSRNDVSAMIKSGDINHGLVLNALMFYFSRES